MVKSKFVSPQQYAAGLSQIITATEDAGAKVAPFFEKLRAAIDEDKLADMPAAEFQEISVEFDDAVEVYMDAAAKLKALKAPVRFMGQHSVMAKTFAEYADATDDMAKSLKVDAQTVDMPAFEKSETDQDNLMDKFLGQVRRIMKAGV